MRNVLFLPNASRSKVVEIPATGTQISISDVFGPNFYVAQALAPFEVAFDQPDQWFYAEQGFSFENIGFGDRTFQRIWIRAVNLPGSELQTVRIVYGAFKQNLVTLKNVPYATVSRITSTHVTIPQVGFSPGLILGADPGRISAEIGWTRGPDDNFSPGILFAWGFGLDNETSETACFEAADEAQAFASSTFYPPFASRASDTPNHGLAHYISSSTDVLCFTRRNARIEGPSPIYGSSLNLDSEVLFANTPYRLRIKTTHLL